ncbi:thiamine phosphate synthase [Maricaulis sp.]|uniref:thiamine phosphate synthase n=1 Tax=Maricaulis sp. TaxID=1486257 RepID=UPI0026355996|nr:thiamine phosphate synthase [Maricaulis sp.]
MTPPYDAVQRLARQAMRVRGSAAGALPPLIALTDPARTPDAAGYAAGLEPGSGLIYRHFGADDRFETGRALASIARERGLVLLVSADPELADAIGAAGLHWPETRLAQAFARRCRGDRRPFTSAAHSPLALARARASGVDAALFSPVFPSASPSAGRAKGLWAAAAAARRAALPVYALGGVNTQTAARLENLGFSGIACVGAIRSAGPTRT